MKGLHRVRCLKGPSPSPLVTSICSTVFINPTAFRACAPGHCCLCNREGKRYNEGVPWASVDPSLQLHCLSLGLGSPLFSMCFLQGWTHPGGQLFLLSGSVLMVHGEFWVISGGRGGPALSHAARGSRYLTPLLGLQPPGLSPLCLTLPPITS